MKPHNITKRCGCFMRAANSKEWHIAAQHPRARLVDGKLISYSAAGSVAAMRLPSRISARTRLRGFDEGLRAVERVIGPSAMNSLAAAARSGERGLPALLHACKGACVGTLEFERAAEFRDMADAEASRMRKSKA